MAVDALRDMSLAVGAWMRAHQRGAAAMSALPGALGAVLAPTPLPLCDDMKAVLAAVPSARLDAWVANGGRCPGQSVAEALALEEALQTVHASSAALQTAARDAEQAAEALLDALRRGAAAADGLSDSPASASTSGSQPHSEAAPATRQAEEGGAVADPLDGISSEVLHGCYRSITWGQWVAMVVTTAASLAREAQLRHAMSEALLHAPAPGAGGEGPELCVELCDSLAQLWRLQPHLDDALLRALLTATQGE